MKKNRIRIFVALAVTGLVIGVGGFYVIFKSSNLVCQNDVCFCLGDRWTSSTSAFSWGIILNAATRGGVM